MSRPYIELPTKTGKSTKKYYAKSSRSLHDMMRVMRLGKKMQQLETKEDYIPVDEFDEMFEFIVEMYDNKFTVEDLARSLPYGEEGFKQAMEILNNLSLGDSDDENLTK